MTPPYNSLSTHFDEGFSKNKCSFLQVLCGSSSVRTVSFSLDGNVVVSGSLDGWVSLWSWEAQVLLSRFKAHSGYTLTSNFLRHGEYLLTGGEDGKVIGSKSVLVTLT